MNKIFCRFCIFLFCVWPWPSRGGAEAGGAETTSIQNDDDDDGVADEGIAEFEIYEIRKDDRLRACGHWDKCVSSSASISIGGSTLMSTDKEPAYVPGQEKLTMNFQTNPFSCRCDVEECSKYGDCCVELNVPLSEELRNGSVLYGRKTNPWHCQTVQKQLPQISALMISECPAGSDQSRNILCSALVSQIPPDAYTYLVDLPAYSNTSKILYKNIFCALCHGESASNLVKWTLRFYCNHEFPPLQRPLFFEAATYQPKSREWTKGNKTCKLVIPELENTEIESNIPNIRYCGFTTETDHCPADYKGPNSENYTLLCTSYTQYVFNTKTAKQYKNPHCAVCNGVEDPSTLRCVRYMPAPETRVKSPESTGAQLEGIGLNFLFDFSTEQGNNYVGYEMLCSEDEIWDYIRQKCHPIICGTNHVLVGGSCELRPGSGPNSNLTADVNESNSSMAPNCFRIILQAHDFQIFANKSIAVNRTNNAIEILNETEYELLANGTAMICAKNLHEAFASRFSIVLHYLTMVSLGSSVTFSFLHMFLFSVLPKLRNLPAKNLFCLTLCLFISQFSFLTLIQGTGSGGRICISAAILMHFFFLSSFFWMNIMSFDIWRTFSTIRRPGSGSRGNKRRTFIKYNVFGWSIPFVIVLAAAGTDWIWNEETEGIASKIKPAYGENGLCWISQRLSLFIFFAVPVAGVIIVNLILFSLTARAILSQQKEASKVLRGEHSKASSDEARLKLYIKLALIMGLTWILGFVSAFWDWLWYPFVVLNGLQGTFIFFSFDFKMKILEMCLDLVVPLRGRKRGMSMSSNTNTTSNQVTLSSELKSRNRLSVVSTAGNSGAVNI